MQPTDPLAELTWRELRPVLDAELERLPEKYRAPLVLCYLQGKTNEEAARQLGWPPGSMSARLARGRAMLGDRLAGRYQGGATDVLRIRAARTSTFPSWTKSGPGRSST